MAQTVSNQIHSPSIDRAFKMVLSSEGGLNASAGLNFKDRLFGRDSLEAAEDILNFEPKIVEKVLLSLARLQGLKVNPSTEEEFGRIHHERWKGSETTKGFLRYDTIDATPLYIRLLADYTTLYGNSFFSQTYEDKEGNIVTIRTSMIRALSWLTNRIEQSDIGLLEFKQTQEDRIENQIWTDSFTAIIDENGKIANHKKPIAAIEVQGLAYDALVKAIPIFTKTNPLLTIKWTKLARRIQKATLSKFWLPDVAYFGRAIDRDDENKSHLIRTLSSSPAELLDTLIFDSLEKKEKKKYIESIITMIFSPEFLTDVGIRTRALKYINLVKFYDYHGSGTSWIKATFDIAKGLRRHGYIQLAEQLEIRILNAVNIAGDFYEFFYVDKDGHVAYDPLEKISESINRKTIIGTNLPEDKQTWTLSAVMAIQHFRQQSESKVKTTKEIKIPTLNPYEAAVNIRKYIRKQIVAPLIHPSPIFLKSIYAESKITKKDILSLNSFEHYLLSRVPIAQLLKTDEEIKEAYLRNNSFKIDAVEGLKIEFEVYRNKPIASNKHITSMRDLHP